MKKSILFVAALFLMGLNSIAQNTYNLVLFSEDGDAFFAFVNGIRQNDKPETNIKVTGLNSEALNVRIEFENKALPKLKQNMMPEFGFEHTVNIRKNMKKEMKMQYFGKVAIADAPKSSASTVAYHTSENSVSTGNSSEFNTSDGGTNTSVTTTTTTTKVGSNPENVSINVNMGGAGMNVNINGMEGNAATMNASTSTTVTTKSSSSSSSSPSGAGSATIKEPVQKTEPLSQPISNSGCRGAMPSTNYDKMKKSVEDKPFSDTKMSTAKVATKNSCLSVEQIKGICGLFSMDDDKLAYAKFAYNYCTDKANYYQVSEAFSFSGTTDSLNKFLEEN